MLISLLFASLASTSNALHARQISANAYLPDGTVSFVQGASGVTLSSTDNYATSQLQVHDSVDNNCVAGGASYSVNDNSLSLDPSSANYIVGKALVHYDALGNALSCADIVADAPAASDSGSAAPESGSAAPTESASPSRTRTRTGTRSRSAGAESGSAVESPTATETATGGAEASGSAAPSRTRGGGGGASETGGASATGGASEEPSGSAAPSGSKGAGATGGKTSATAPVTAISAASGIVAHGTGLWTGILAVAMGVVAGGVLMQ